MRHRYAAGDMRRHTDWLQPQQLRHESASECPGRDGPGHNRGAPRRAQMPRRSRRSCSPRKRRDVRPRHQGLLHRRLVATGLACELAKAPRKPGRATGMRADGLSGQWRRPTLGLTAITFAALRSSPPRIRRPGSWVRACHHGFAMLGLAEVGGAVDDRNLWPDGKGPRSIGAALELAVCGATIQVPRAIFSRRPGRRYVGQRCRFRRAFGGPQRRHRGA